MQRSTPPSQVPVKTSYRGISSDQMLLTKTAMTELRTHLSFTQLRFHCSKKKGRTFHVTTVEDDNSLLAGVCRKWGLENVYEVGKWGHGQDQDRLYIYPAFAKAAYHWYIAPPTFYCDDYYTNLVGFSSGDFWKVFVR